MNYLIDEMDEQEYRSHKAISNSDLSNVKKLGASVIEHRANAKRIKFDNKNLTIGRAAHALILEGEDVFLSQFAKSPAFNLRKTADKEAKAKFDAECESAGVEVLLDADYQACYDMRDSVMSHPIAGKLFSDSRGVAERSYFWTDDKTGIECKARMDWIIDDALFPQIVDLKTTGDISDIAKSIVNFGYYRQAFHYSEGFEKVHNVSPSFCFVFVSKNPSFGYYDVSVIKLPYEAIQKGKIEIESLLRNVLESKDSSYIEIPTIEMPAWFR